MTIPEVMALRAVWRRHHGKQPLICAISLELAESMRQELGGGYASGDYRLTSLRTHPEDDITLLLIDPALTGGAVRFEGPGC